MKKHSVVLGFAGAILIWAGALILLGLFPPIAGNRYLFAFLATSAVLGGGFLFCRALVDWSFPRR